MKHIYSVATGAVNILVKRSRAAALFMKKQEGFVAVLTDDFDPNREVRCLWFYDSLNHATTARNNAEANGIICGTNIVEFYMEDGDWVPGEVVG